MTWERNGRLCQSARAQPAEISVTVWSASQPFARFHPSARRFGAEKKFAVRPSAGKKRPVQREGRGFHRLSAARMRRLGRLAQREGWASMRTASRPGEPAKAGTGSRPQGMPGNLLPLGQAAGGKKTSGQFFSACVFFGRALTFTGKEGRTVRAEFVHYFKLLSLNVLCCEQTAWELDARRNQVNDGADRALVPADAGVGEASPTVRSLLSAAFLPPTCP